MESNRAAGTVPISSYLRKCLLRSQRRAAMGRSTGVRLGLRDKACGVSAAIAPGGNSYESKYADRCEADDQTNCRSCGELDLVLSRTWFESMVQWYVTTGARPVVQGSQC